jgi:uncharacterized membrane protein
VAIVLDVDQQVPMTPELPPNWRSAKDSDGKEYYFNELTGETSWKVPEAESNGAAAAESATPGVAAADSAEFARNDPADDGAAGDEVPQRPSRRSFSARLDVSGLSGTLGEGVLPRLFVIMFCSLVLLIQAAINITLEHAEYGVAVGSVSLGLTILFCLYAKYKPQRFATWKATKLKDLSLSQLFSLFLTIWWSFGTAVLTFFGPFTQTSNAYFAIWACAIASLLSLASSFTRVSNAFMGASSVREDPIGKYMAGLAISSFVVMFCSFEWVRYGNSSGTFALIAGIVSTCLALLFYYLNTKKKFGGKLRQFAAVAFTLLWCVSVCVLTFNGPFTVTGNGFFAVWAATVCSLGLSYQVGSPPLYRGCRDTTSTDLARSLTRFLTPSLSSHSPSHFTALLSRPQTFFEKELPLGSSIRRSLSSFKPYGQIDEVSQSSVNPTIPSYGGNPSGLPPA